MEDMEKYLSELQNCEQNFFGKDGLKAIRRNGTIDFKSLHNFLIVFIKDWEKLPALEKLKHFIRLWYIETDLAEKIECAHTDIYSNGRRRALSDVEDLIEKMQNKEV